MFIDNYADTAIRDCPMLGCEGMVYGKQGEVCLSCEEYGCEFDGWCDCERY